jgi:excisionase family DNA binding protein
MPQGTKSKTIDSTALPWRDTVNLTISRAAEIAGVSTASLYQMRAKGELTFVRLGGRTLVDTESLKRLLAAAASKPWEASGKGEAARASRVERARAAWPG